MAKMTRGDNDWSMTESALSKHVSNQNWLDTQVMVGAQVTADKRRGGPGGEINEHDIDEAWQRLFSVPVGSRSSLECESTTWD